MGSEPHVHSTRSRESFRIASDVSFACVQIFFLTIFGHSGHVAMCYWVKSCGLPQDGHARHTNYGSAGLCLPGKSMFAWSKTTAPSWPKVVRPVANDKDVAIALPVAVAGHMAYSWLKFARLTT